MANYEVRDINLAPAGKKRIEWVKNNMPLLRGIEERMSSEKPLKDIKISLSIHLEPKTAYLCQVLSSLGADTSVTGSNILSTQDATAAALADQGMKVFAYHGATESEYKRHIEMCLANKPNIIIDDGGDLVGMLHSERSDLAKDAWGGCEETTTGIIRLKAMEKQGVLKFPMVAVNDARCKHLFDNRYGTGQSVWASIMTNTNLIVASKTVVVAGYGWCGKGIAMRAAALGASVIVTEIDAVKAIEARMDGFQVMSMMDAAPLGDIFVTVTGCNHVIGIEHMSLMKNRAILANAGHFNVEIDMEQLETKAMDKYESRENIMAYVLPGDKIINVIAEGRLVNIAAADGHPAEIMDMSFAVQLYSALYIKDNKDRLENKVYDVSQEIDEVIAKDRLDAWGIGIDELSPQQEKYLNSWEL